MRREFEQQDTRGSKCSSASGDSHACARPLSARQESRRSAQGGAGAGGVPSTTQAARGALTPRLTLSPPYARHRQWPEQPRRVRAPRRCLPDAAYRTLPLPALSPVAREPGEPRPAPTQLVPKDVAGRYALIVGSDTLDVYVLRELLL